MKMSSFHFLLFLVVFCFSSCGVKKEKIARAWLFSIAEYPDENAGTDFESDLANPMSVSQESFLNLQEDGSYTSYFGVYEQGQWELKEGALQLKPISGWKVIVFKVRSLKDGKLRLYYAPRGAMYTFQGYYNHFPDPSNNPFYYTNNKWRTKATRPETEKEINERIKNHFRFFEKYFEWIQKTKIDAAHISSVASPIEIFSNGFKLKSIENQPYEWKQLFYSREDFDRAYQKIERIFRDRSVDWRSEEETYKMLQTAFHRMQNMVQ